MESSYLLYFCDGIGSVFDSQVLALITTINKKNFFKKVYLFLGVRNKDQKNDILARKGLEGIEIVFFRSYLNYPFFNHLIRRSIKAALLNNGINLKQAIFQTRGELIAWHLSKILESPFHNKIIPDIRGTSIEEIKEFYTINHVQKTIKIYNNKLALKNLNKFDKISVVSRSLKEYLINNFNVKEEKIYITPSLAGTEFKYDESRRHKIRNELNLMPDDILIVFSSGGTANWQNNDILIELAEKGLKVLNLSRKGFNHKNIINKFVNYSEMPAYLNAADVAIIWRDKSVVNETASPVKFSEYICCGLPVVANKNVNTITDFIKTYGCGLLIESLEEVDLNKLIKLKLQNRRQISELGTLNFGINEIVRKYCSTYTCVVNL